MEFYKKKGGERKTGVGEGNYEWLRCTEAKSYITHPKRCAGINN